MDTKKIVASNVKFHRTIMLEMSQEELSDAIGYSQQTISRIETAVTEASAGFLIAFATYAKISLDNLCGLNPTIVSVEGLTEKQIKRIEHEIKLERLKNLE